MTQKLLVIGAGGFVGGVLAHQALLAGWAVTGAGRNTGAMPAGVTRKTMDITSRDDISKTFDEITPDAVICTAAVADIDAAQRDQATAWNINVEGPRLIAQLCRSRTIRFIFTSSDAVFRGDRERYAETDTPDPVNFYGHTKAEAEKAVLAEHPQSAVARISLVLGLPMVRGNSFVSRLLDSLRQGNAVAASADEIRTPIDVHTLCDALLELCTSDYSGILHLATTRSISRFDLTKKIALQAGFDTSLVTQSPTVTDPSRALRHKNGILDVSKARNILKTPLLTIDETISKALCSLTYAPECCPAVGGGQGYAPTDKTPFPPTGHG